MTTTGCGKKKKHTQKDTGMPVIYHVIIKIIKTGDNERPHHNTVVFIGVTKVCIVTKVQIFVNFLEIDGQFRKYFS